MRRFLADEIDLGRAGLAERLAQIDLQGLGDLGLVFEHHPFKRGELAPAPGQIARHAAVEGGAQGLDDRSDIGSRGRLYRHDPSIEAIQKRMRATPSAWAVERPISGIITAGLVEAMR
ncbi:hypothetical protein D3C80_1150530 [compost metagenome]